jgi:hypothetical protein
VEKGLIIWLTPTANLPPVSATPAVLVANLLPFVDTSCKFATSVVETGGKFAAGVIDTGGKLATGVADTVGAP